MLLTYKYRIKDANTAKYLNRMAVQVNQVWNYCGQIQNDSKRLNKFWPSKFQLINLTSGSGKELGLHSDTVQDICKQFCISRKQAGKKPAWRVSSGAKKSLGWIPFQSVRAIGVDGNTITYLKKKYRVWLSRAIPDIIRSGSFNQDAQGRWYINLVCEVQEADRKQEGLEIGIDPNLSNIIATSDGRVFENPRWYRNKQKEIALAQKRGKKQLEKRLHRKIRNQRKHLLHMISTQLVRESKLLAVGNVNSISLAKTNMAKSVYDVAWGMLRSMFPMKDEVILQNKAIRQGACYLEVDERWSTQTCSVCKQRSGPKGLKGLGVRYWTCEGCGSHHSRDVNSARNILVSGRNIAFPQTEILAINGGEDVNTADIFIHCCSR